MADDIVSDPGSGGATWRSFTTAADVQHAAAVAEYVTTLSAGANVLQPVMLTSGLPVQPQTGATWAVTQSGSWTVAATQSGTWTVTGAGGTFPVTDSGGSLTVDDGGSSLTVDGTVSVSGTVTVGSHDVTNAGTFAVQAAQSGTWNVTNISGTVSLPTGAATAVKQPALGTAGSASADVITVQGIASMTALKVDGSGVTQPVSDGGGSLTVDGTVAVTGTFWQATQPVSLASVPSHAVTNAGTFAVQVDGSALTSLQLIDDVVFAEDAAHVSGDKGVMALAVRSDTAASTGGTDGDYTALITDSAGKLHVNVGNTVTVGSHAVTNAGTFAVQAAQSGTWTVQPGNTANTTAWLVTGTGGTFPATQSGTWNVATVTTVSTITNVVHVDDNSGSLTVDNGGTFAVQATVAASATNIAKAEDVASADADVGVPAMAVRKATPANTSNTDGDYEFLQMSAGRLWTDTSIGHLAGNAVSTGNGASGTGVLRVAQVSDGTGVLAGVTTVTTLTTCSTVTTLANGQTAHDGASTGSPLRVGAKAETAISGVTLVSDGDATDLYAGVDGVLIVREHCNLEDVVQERTTNTDGASTAFASGLAAPGSGVRLWVTSVDICNSSATFCTVDLRDGAAGSVLWTLPVPATGGVVKTFNPPLKLTVNTALAFDASAATTTLTISVNGFKSKV